MSIRKHLINNPGIVLGDYNAKSNQKFNFKVERANANTPPAYIIIIKRRVAAAAA